MIFALCALALLVGCEQYMLQIPDRGKTNVSIINAATNAPYIRIESDVNQVVFRNAAGTALMQRLPTTASRFRVFTDSSASASPRFLTLTFAPEKHNTIVIFDQLAGVAFDSRLDVLPSSEAGKVKVRLFHFGEYDNDITVFTGDAPLFTDSTGKARPFFFPETYISSFTTFDVPQTANFTFAIQDFSDNKKLTEVSSSLSSGGIYTILVYGKNSTGGLKATVVKHELTTEF